MLLLSLLREWRSRRWLWHFLSLSILITLRSCIKHLFWYEEEEWERIAQTSNPFLMTFPPWFLLETSFCPNAPNLVWAVHPLNLKSLIVWNQIEGERESLCVFLPRKSSVNVSMSSCLPNPHKTLYFHCLREIFFCCHPFVLESFWWTHVLILWTALSILASSWPHTEAFMSCSFCCWAEFHFLCDWGIKVCLWSWRLLSKTQTVKTIAFEFSSSLSVFCVVIASLSVCVIHSLWTLWSPLPFLVSLVLYFTFLTFHPKREEGYHCL